MHRSGKRPSHHLTQPLSKDRRTLPTRNGCLAAQYEHTVIIRKGAPWLVTG
jgi:methionine aminopeptidase